MATYHIRPRPANGTPDEWAVEKVGASRASAVKGTKAAAAGAARNIADPGDTLVTHDANGGVMGRSTAQKTSQSAKDKLAGRDSIGFYYGKKKRR